MIRSADEFVRLRTSDDPVEYGRAAHDDAPLEVWLSVIEQYPDMRDWVAHNKTVPIEILRLLSGDLDPRVRTMVAMKRKLPEQLQLALAVDLDESVRDQIAHNAKATKAALEALARDPEDRIRTVAAERLAAGRHA